ncbi:hypothetical protein DSCO28_08930 [Desulfosarcina ovata subsp. sediminis]|uniref:Uncharacterized protein n=1 Tax=Desulfosarcina ovata subsp. sediminis TaxID=885957 RepID=A0A5K7ZK15_9BACT|nr:hypothetical protein [Desulfosarcina ovata]BBO80327.1 hypothetical protein DSCO28_08930 [Desulfosarcina ovata subsp. sediminis]
MKINFWIIVGGMLLMIVILSPHPLSAERGYNERDKMTDERIKVQGFRPVPFNGFTISADDPKWDERVSYLMSKHSALLVEIAPMNEPISVIMFVSSPASCRGMQAAWAYDHLTFPMRFWTNRYWVSNKTCDTTGCPRIMFKATKGTLEVTILDTRP